MCPTGLMYGLEAEGVSYLQAEWQTAGVSAGHMQGGRGSGGPGEPAAARAQSPHKCCPHTGHRCRHTPAKDVH